jgi:LPXTG-site transpeptidase (sortase) family protein
LPTRLKIPVININAGIEYVGLTSDGAMDVPKNPNNVAWYSPGSHPGENGSAVIAGHLDDKNGKPAVFYYLNKLKVGDKIYVQDDKDTTIIFVVRESRSYDPKADATDVFTSNDGKSHLNLITCEGSWNHSANSYSKRLVVFTDGESDRR